MLDHGVNGGERRGRRRSRHSLLVSVFSVRSRVLRGVAVGMASALVWTAPVDAGGTSLADRAQGAIVAAVRERLGARAEVRVEELRVKGTLDGPIVAVPNPGSRLGGRIRFVLRPVSGQPRTADADAMVVVSLPHLRAARALRRGEPIEADAVTELNGELSGVPLQALPDLGSVVGATVNR